MFHVCYTIGNLTFSGLRKWKSYYQSVNRLVSGSSISSPGHREKTMSSESILSFGFVWEMLKIQHNYSLYIHAMVNNGSLP